MESFNSPSATNLWWLLRRQYPAFYQKNSILNLGLVPRFVRSRGHDGGVVMLGHLGIGYGSRSGLVAASARSTPVQSGLSGTMSFVVPPMNSKANRLWQSIQLARCCPRAAYAKVYMLAPSTASEQRGRFGLACSAVINGDRGVRPNRRTVSLRPRESCLEG